MRRKTQGIPDIAAFHFRNTAALRRIIGGVSSAWGRALLHAPLDKRGTPVSQLLAEAL